MILCLELSKNLMEKRSVPKRILLLLDTESSNLPLPQAGSNTELNLNCFKISAMKKETSVLV